MDRVKEIPFNVSARMAVLIGRENIPNLYSAITELIKNSYDADADACVIYYDDVNDKVCLFDNGSGMTEQDIIDYWMNLGISMKLTKPNSKKGRIRTGSKGVGRFALDKIAENCTMITKTESDNLLKWDVEWEKLNTIEKISDVYAKLSYNNHSYIEGIQNIVHNKNVLKIIEKHNFEIGTMLEMRVLREKWTQRKISKIRKQLTQLIPSGLCKNFKLYFFTSSEMNIEEALISVVEENTYDYKVIFDYNDSILTTKVFRNEFDFRGEFEYVMKEGNFSQEDRNYFNGEPKIEKLNISEEVVKHLVEASKKIGDFSGELYFRKLSQQSKEREKLYYKYNTSIRKSNIFGGIKLYRDNFRVRPFGEVDTKSYDWLNLNSRKNASPSSITHTGSWKVRAEQMQGTIHISKKNKGINDTLSRDGIVDTHEFSVFEKIIIKAIVKLEEDRQDVMRKLNLLYQKKHPVEVFEKEIKEMAKNERNNEKRQDNNQNFNDSSTIQKTIKLIEHKNEVIDNLEDENRILRTLATSGIITNSYSHEISSFNSLLSRKLNVLKIKISKDDKNYRRINEVLNSMEDVLSNYSSWFDVTIQTLESNKRIIKELNVNNIIRNVVESWKTLLEVRNISINYNESESPIYLECFEYDLVVILNNLISNSMDAFRIHKTPKNKKKISLSCILVDDGRVSIEYSDLGPGLIGEFKENPQKVLEPLISSKDNGTGLGLWIIKKIATEYNGEVILNSKYEGFYIKILLKQKDDNNE